MRREMRRRDGVLCRPDYGDCGRRFTSLECVMVECDEIRYGLENLDLLGRFGEEVCK